MNTLQKKKWFVVFRFYSQVLSKCRKCHFRDPKFKTFLAENPPNHATCHHFVGAHILGAHTCHCSWRVSESFLALTLDQLIEVPKPVWHNLYVDEPLKGTLIFLLIHWCPSSLFARAVFSKTSTAHSTSHSHFEISAHSTSMFVVMTTKNIVLRIINWNPQPIDHLLRLDLVGFWEIIHK